MHTKPTVSASLQAFMAHLIDYAGLFPPAKLPLPAAIAEYAELRKQPERWMLSRFIIPAAQLNDLSNIAASLFTLADPFVFSILGRSGHDANDFMLNLRADLDDVHAFKQRHGKHNGSGVVPDVFEVRLPAVATATNDPATIVHLLDEAGQIISGEGEMRPFYEVTFDANWEHAVTAAVTAIASHNATTTHKAAGYKLRCGGMEAAAFPSPTQVAHAIHTCNEHKVALKATAGLHHPIRHYAESVRTMMHGFFNVFGAGILAHSHALSPDQLTAILNDENPDNFRFDATKFAWRDLSVSAPQIEAVRQNFMISYGSCSFDEPREDLRRLHLLD
jgi:hypothetical protein